MADDLSDQQISDIRRVLREHEILLLSLECNVVELDAAANFGKEVKQFHSRLEFIEEIATTLHPVQNAVVQNSAEQPIQGGCGIPHNSNAAS